VANAYVLVRLNNMRGIDLDRFDFDFDTTWAAFFMNADGHIYGRFGGRDADSAEKYASLAGLRYALRAALEVHRHDHPEPSKSQELKARTVEQYASAERLQDAKCIHCHQVREVVRDSAQRAGTWQRELEWVYPPPENVGLSLDPEQGNRVTKVVKDSAADRIGIQPLDILTCVNGLSVASYADVQYALHRAPEKGTIPVVWQHQGETRQGNLVLAAGWRQSDISWRWSLRRLEPSPWVQGDDLGPAEKKTLGLATNRLALQQGNFVSKPARDAGIRQNDVIVGVDDKPLEMTGRQFIAYVRLNYQVGDRITFNIIRNGQRLNLPMTLPGRGRF
jgi:predicted metalloprotease with PDZ domain